MPRHPTRCLSGFDGLPAIHYNDDVVLEVPSGATVLATLPDGRPQALRFGPSAWGVQFHPETSPEVFGAWLRWDSPDGLTPEQEALLAEVSAAREVLRGGVAAVRRALRGARVRRMPWRGVRPPSRPESRSVTPA